MVDPHRGRRPNEKQSANSVEAVGVHNPLTWKVNTNLAIANRQSHNALASKPCPASAASALTRAESNNMQPAINPTEIIKERSGPADLTRGVVVVEVVKVEPPEANQVPPGESPAVDALQTEIMAAESVDGRPMARTSRTLAWRLVIVGIAVAGAVGFTWAVIRGVDAMVIIGFTLAFIALLGIGGWPVWTAGMLRGKEEAVALDVAIDEVQPTPGAPTTARVIKATAPAATANEQRWEGEGGATIHAVQPDFTTDPRPQTPAS